MNRKRTFPLSILIFLIALVLRLYGVSFGLPHLYHADEPIVVNHALAYGSFDFNPHFFRIPPLVSYLLFGVYGLFYAVGLLVGTFTGVKDFALAYFSDPTMFMLLARILFGSFLGALSVWILFRTIAKHFSDLHGLLASLILATCLLHVRDSHYIYADIPLVFVFILFFGYLWNLKKEGGRPKFYYPVMGILIGLAGAIKYNGVFIAAPFLLYSWCVEPKKERALLGWVIAAATSLFVFILLNPFALLDFKFFWAEIHAESAVHQATHGFLHHVFYSLRYGLGLPVLGMSLIGLLTGAMRRDIKRWSVILFIGLYYFVIFKWGQPYGRYVLPLLPFLILMASDAILNITQSIKDSYRTSLLAVLVIACVFPSLMTSLRLDSILTQADTRTVAKQWVENHLPSGQKIAIENEFYMPRLLMSEKQLKAKMQAMPSDPHFSEQKKWKLDYWIDQAKKQPSYFLYSLKGDLEAANPKFLFEKEPIGYSLKMLRERSINYVIIYDHLKSDPKRVFQDSLAKEAKLVYSITPYANAAARWNSLHPLTGAPLDWSDIWARKRNGPPILVYRLQ